MKTYSEFKPTGFDVAGLGCEEQQDWLVAPCSKTRDSDTLSRSNYATQLAALEKLDPEGNDHEEHSFGHWACGHFELVLVRPGSACATECEGFENALSDYPVLSDEHYSEACVDAENEAWQNWGAHEFLKALAADRDLDRDAFEDASHEMAYLAWYNACQDAGWSAEHNDEGVRFNFGSDVLGRVNVELLLEGAA